MDLRLRILEESCSFGLSPGAWSRAQPAVSCRISHVNGDTHRTPDAAQKDEPPARKSSGLTALRWVWEWTKSILVAFSLFLVIRTFMVEAFRIPTGSME